MKKNLGGGLSRTDVSRIEAIAGKEFNYIGDDSEYSFEGDTYYIGQDGEYDFGGNGKTFAQEGRSGETYGFVIANAATRDVQVALCPAFFDTKARMIAHGFSTVDGILADGVIATIGTADVTCTAIDGQRSLYAFLEFIKRNPTRIPSFTMTSSVEDQFDKQITYQNVSPFRQLGQKTIPLTEFLNTAQLNVKKIDANLLAMGYVLEFNDQNVIILTVAAGAELRINFRLGAVDNRAGKLNRKAGKAHKNIRQAVARR